MNFQTKLIKAFLKTCTLTILILFHQANESLSEFGRPSSTPNVVKVQAGATASQERIPVNRKPMLVIPEVDQRRDYAQYVLQHRFDNVDLRHRNDVMKLYLPYIQSQ